MPQELNVLFVCTGNICRSAAADALASMYFRHAPIHVASAGTRGLIDHPIQPNVGKILLNAGIDASSFRSQRLTQPIAVKQDIIFCFEKRQRSSIVALAPSMVKHTYLLTDFANMCQYADVNGLIPNSDIAGRLRYVDAVSQMLRTRVPEGQEIADPYGKQDEDYQRAVYETAMALKMIIVPSHPAPGMAAAAPGSEYQAASPPNAMGGKPAGVVAGAVSAPVSVETSADRDAFPAAASYVPRHAGRVIRSNGE